MSEAIMSRRQRRRVSAPSSSGRLLVMLAVLLSVAIIGYVVAVTVMLPHMGVSRVVVQADFEMNREALLELAGLSGSPFLFSVRPDEIAARLESHPMIRSAVVERAFPDTVRLELLRRRPLAIALVEHNGMSRPFVVDETGTLFDGGAHLASYDLPVLSGIRFEGNVVGGTLPEEIRLFLARLYDVRLSSPEIFASLSELRFEARGGGEYDVLLFTESFRVPVRLDLHIDREVGKYALMVLDVLAQQGIADDVAEVDFRSGEIVYRLKEDRSVR
ncbi:MAG: FtsQ-type POTRA domain-containing protein [Spirochaetales bacterium]|nr:FtsQ-type POTRA domain-containing protein [Spirochaetales bacterium]